jgi:putative Holliday junction resolvase
MSKILAIDFGLKRSGLAISDLSRMFAFGLKTVNSVDLEQELTVILPNESVDTIVLGLPKRLNNEDSHITENVRMFAEVLKKRFPSCTVELLDERFTSKIAKQAMHTSGASKKQKADKSLVDMVSATIILQSYLEQDSMR